MNASKDLLAGLGMAALALTLTLVLASCVTINVYFPAAAAEKAADKIIDQVYQLDSGRGATGGKPTAQ
jgi:hypothetical protein